MQEYAYTLWLPIYRKQWFKNITSEYGVLYFGKQGLILISNVVFEQITNQNDTG